MQTALAHPVQFPLLSALGYAGGVLIEGAGFLASASAEEAEWLYTLFADEDTLPNVSQDEGTEYNLGMVFTSAEGGDVTGVRVYYPGAPHTMTIPHIYLWLHSTGALIATKATGGLTPVQGWNEVLFDTPVPVTADTRYIVGYKKPSGEDYPYQHLAFLSAVENGPITGIADGDAPNGVFYAWSVGSEAPTNSFSSASYGVDVILSLPAEYVPTLPLMMMASLDVDNVIDFTAEKEKRTIWAKAKDALRNFDRIMMASSPTLDDYVAMG